MSARVVKFLQDYEGELTGDFLHKVGSSHAEDQYPYSLKVDGLIAAGVVELADDLSEKPLKELKAIAKDLGLKGYSKLKADAIIEMIKAAPETEEEAEESED